MKGLGGLLKGAPMWWNRQTRCLEGAVGETPCQFESGHRHRARLLYPALLAAVVVMLAAASLFVAAPANALLMGEKAKHAPVAPLRIAVQMYDKGASDKAIWQKTGWYCPNRDTSVCRWETPPACTKISLMNMTAIQHTSFTGGIPLWRVFNAACVWKEYPSLQNKVVVYMGGCHGAWGTASHNGETGAICISGELFHLIKSGAPKAKDSLYRVFIHELQHQIQFIERWSAFNRDDCPYKRRWHEREAFYVDAREFASAEKRKNTAPVWHKPGLC